MQRAISLSLALALGVSPLAMAGDKDPSDEDLTGWTHPEQQEYLQYIVDESNALIGEDALTGKDGLFGDVSWRDIADFAEFSQTLTELEALAGLGFALENNSGVVELEDLAGPGKDAATIYDPFSEEGKYSCEGALCAGMPDAGSLVGSVWSVRHHSDGTTWAGRTYDRDDGVHVVDQIFFDPNGEATFRIRSYQNQDGCDRTLVTEFYLGDGWIKEVRTHEDGENQTAFYPGPKPHVPEDGTMEEPAEKPLPIPDPKKFQPADGAEGSYCPLILWSCREMMEEAENAMKDPYRIIEGGVHVLTDPDAQDLVALRLAVDSGDLVSDPDSWSSDAATELGSEVIYMSLPVLILPPGPNETLLLDLKSDFYDYGVSAIEEP